MARNSPLDDPALARFAWRRFRRLMFGMGVLTLATVGVTMVMLYREMGFVSIHFYIATALGVSFAMMMVSVLMGLVFLSNGTDHDSTVGTGDDDGLPDQDEGGYRR